MASFDNITITHAGRQMMAMSFALQQSVEFTRIAIGDGIAPEDPEKLEELVNHCFNVTITRVGLSKPDVATLRGVFKPAELQEDFLLREVGVYAQLPGFEEILFAYANAGDNADVIPKANGSTIMEEVFILSILVGKATVLIQDFDPTAHATIEDIDEKIDLLNIDDLRLEIEDFHRRLAEINEKLEEAELGYVSKAGDTMNGNLIVPVVEGRLDGSADKWNNWHMFSSIVELSSFTGTELNMGTCTPLNIIDAMPDYSRLVVVMKNANSNFPMPGISGILEVMKHTERNATILFSSNSGDSWRGIAQSSSFKWYGSNDVPPGAVIAYAGEYTTLPVGYLRCDGSSFSRTTYSALYQVIATTYGAADGNTFKVPDYRGYFLRAKDNSRGIDTSRTLGSVQSDAIRNITGSLNNITTHGLTSGGAVSAYPIGTDYVSGMGTSWYQQGFSFNAANVVPTAHENRPKNIAVNYLIKY